MRRRAGVLGLVIAVLVVLWRWQASRETKVPEVASKAAITEVSRDPRARAKNATLSGRVTRAKDGAPIADAVIAIAVNARRARAGRDDHRWLVDHTDRGGHVRPRINSLDTTRYPELHGTPTSVMPGERWLSLFLGGAERGQTYALTLARGVTVNVTAG